MTTSTLRADRPAHRLDDLMRWLEAEFELVPEPPHGGTWRNMFYKTVNRHPATTTRVLKILTDANGLATKLQLTSSSDNNNCVLMDIAEDLSLLAPFIHDEIHTVVNKVARKPDLSQEHRIRLAVASDAAGIAQLHAESWRKAYRGMLSDAYLDGDIIEEKHALWHTRLTSPATNQHVAVVDDGDDIIGLACAFGAHDPTWGTLLENLHVAPTHKRKGLGRALVNHVRNWSAQSHPAMGLHLWVLGPNTSAQNFYRQLNARPVGESTWHAPDGSRIGQHRYTWPEPLLVGP